MEQYQWFARWFFMAKDPYMNESEFYMWRSVFAFAMADHTMPPAELDLLNEYRAEAKFSPEQLVRLRDDFLYPHNPEEFYNSITDDRHKKRFCAMARALAWADGDLSKQDETILKRMTCLNSGSNIEIFRNSRTDPELRDFHDQYTKSGMLGLWQTPPRIVEMRA